MIKLEELENMAIVTVILREYVSILDREDVEDSRALLREEKEAIHRFDPGSLTSDKTFNIPVIILHNLSFSYIVCIF